MKTNERVINGVRFEWRMESGHGIGDVSYFVNGTRVLPKDFHTIMLWAQIPAPATGKKT